MDILHNVLHIVPVQDHALQVGGDTLALQKGDGIPDQDQGHLEDGERAEVGQDLGAPRGEGEVIGDCNVIDGTVLLDLLYTSSTLCISICKLICFLDESTVLQVDVSV